MERNSRCNKDSKEIFHRNLIEMEPFLLIFLMILSPILALLLIDYYLHHNKMGKLIDKIPGPKCLPIVGNALSFFLPSELMWCLYRMNAKKFYPVYRIWVCNRPIVNIQHPDDIEILLKSQSSDKSYIYDTLHAWLSHSVLTVKGSKWSKRRKLITPAFHVDILSEYVYSVVEHSDRLLIELKTQNESGEIVKNLLPMFSKLTFDIVCETILGTTSGDNMGQNEYRNSVDSMQTIFLYRTVRPWLKNDWIFSLTAMGKKEANNLPILHDFVTNIIRKRKQYHEETGGKYLNKFSTTNTKTGASHTDLSENRKRLAFLDLLIAASHGEDSLSDRDIREETHAFIVGGYDTAAIALVFVTLLLAENKNVQERCRQEVREIMEACNGNLTIKEIKKFHYIERCIMEGLRLYPSVPGISRKTTQDMLLKYCFIPKGTTVFVHIADTHRDPNFWPRPNIFDPDRFLPEKLKNRHAFAYLPFSAGPRDCIGKKFAMLEMKTVIAKLLQDFYLEPMDQAANVQLQPGMMLRCRHPVYVKFIPIK